MTSKIEIVREHLGHRIEGEPREDGKWLVWDCRFSAQTMDKFVGRCGAGVGAALDADHGWLTCRAARRCGRRRW